MLLFQWTTVKIKESEKTNRGWDLARELKKLQYIKVNVISVVTGIIGIVRKGLKKRLGLLEIRGRIEIIPSTAL